MKDLKVNIGSDKYIPFSRDYIIAYSKQKGLRKALYYDAAYNDKKIKCTIVANHKGWITAVTDKGAVIQEWAGSFHIGVGDTNETHDYT